MRRLGLLVASLVTAALLAGCHSWLAPEKTAGSFTVHKVYSDHMVLQRDRPVKISGNCPAGESVKVTIGSSSVCAVANEKGEWVATLPAMKAGGPYAVTVEGKDDKSKVIFSDVLIGEVWICSGQSNMEFGLRACNDAKNELANASHPGIRLFNTTARRSTSPVGPQHEIAAGPGWEVCTPATAANFSGVGYFFGRQLHQDLNVPVGLINSSWGGTPIESWISLEGYKSAGRSKELAIIATADKKNESAEASARKIKAEYDKKFNDWEAIFFGKYKTETAKAANWKNESIDMTGWEKISLPGDVDAPGIDGVVWVRRTFDAPADWANKNLTLSIGSVDDCDQTFFNGELIGSTGADVPMCWSVPRNYSIPAKLVKAGANTIAIRVIDYAFAGGVNGHITLAPADAKTKKIDLAGTWLRRVEFAIDPKAIPERPNVLSAQAGVKSPNFPATLYNSMVAPWTVYPVRGAIWYQGESNAGNARDYMILHQLLISNWRALWNDPEFGFFFVQLAAFEKHTPKARLPEGFWKGREPQDPAWAKLREVQTATLNVPNTGMAVAIDIGDHSDIHPTNKQDVGFRLAKEAERVMYGMKIISAGPMFEKMQIEDGKIRISYKNVGSGLVAKGGALGQFAIAGADGKFVWANAVIDGDTVVVASEKVKAPVNVRYAWDTYPVEANLYNKEGFPACPFRTDEAKYLLKK